MSRKSTRLRNLLVPYILPRLPSRYPNRGDGDNIFGCEVLVGNWFENRLCDKKDKKAITPGIYGSSSCMKDVSTYHSDFKQPVIMNPGYSLQIDSLMKWNSPNSTIKNIEFSNGDQFVNNFTSLNDIMYRIMPKQDKNSKVLMPKKERVNDDYMRSFGNSTRTGLLQWLKCEKYKENNEPVDMSRYKYDFKHFKNHKRVTSYKPPPKKTSLIGDD